MSRLDAKDRSYSLDAISAYLSDFRASIFDYFSKSLNNDFVVIYTGYTKEECDSNGWLKKLREYKNVIVKFGRYIPKQATHYDKTLGVYLASDNQYAEVIC